MLWAWIATEVMTGAVLSFVGIVLSLLVFTASLIYTIADIRKRTWRGPKYTRIIGGHKVKYYRR